MYYGEQLCPRFRRTIRCYFSEKSWWHIKFGTVARILINKTNEQPCYCSVHKQFSTFHLSALLGQMLQTCTVIIMLFRNALSSAACSSNLSKTLQKRCCNDCYNLCNLPNTIIISVGRSCLMATPHREDRFRSHTWPLANSSGAIVWPLWPPVSINLIYMSTTYKHTHTHTCTTCLMVVALDPRWRRRRRRCKRV